MSISILDKSFEGPYKSPESLKNNSGVYVILDAKSDSHAVIDVGESGEVKDRVKNHDRAKCWAREARNIRYAVYYTPGWTQAQRMVLEKKIRDKFDPPCGKV